MRFYCFRRIGRHYSIPNIWTCQSRLHTHTHKLSPFHLGRLINIDNVKYCKIMQCTSDETVIWFQQVFGPPRYSDKIMFEGTLLAALWKDCDIVRLVLTKQDIRGWLWVFMGPASSLNCLPRISPNRIALVASRLQSDCLAQQIKNNVLQSVFLIQNQFKLAESPTWGLKSAWKKWRHCHWYLVI